MTVLSEKDELLHEIARIARDQQKIIDDLLVAARTAGFDEDPLVTNQILEATHRLGEIQERIDALARES